MGRKKQTSDCIISGKQDFANLCVIVNISDDTAGNYTVKVKNKINKKIRKQNVMEIVGNQVILRTMNDQDKDLLLALSQDLAGTKVTGAYTVPRSPMRPLRVFYSLQNSDSHLPCIIADKKNPQTGWGIIILSHMDFDRKTAEIYIKLITSSRGKGYAQDAINTLVVYAFQELGLKHLYANIQEHNIISQKLCENCGFKRECLQQSRSDSYGNHRNIYVYGITNGG